MSDAPLDPDLRDAFVPEFRAGLGRLAAATNGTTALRILAGLRGMAEAVRQFSLLRPLEAAAAAAQPWDRAALEAAITAAGAGIDRIAAREAPPAPVIRPAVRALVVAASADLRRLLREALEADRAFEVVGEAGDGEAALAFAAELAPDLILLDIEMPGMDGIAMLRRWALEGAGAVVVVSSAAAPGSPLARQVRQLGAAAVVARPSGALSSDLAGMRGAALRAAARRAAGLAPAEGAEP